MNRKKEDQKILDLANMSYEERLEPIALLNEQKYGKKAMSRRLNKKIRIVKLK